MEELKLLLTGRVVENASNRGKGVRGEAVMKAVVAELVRNGPKAACFAAFEWAYENHLNELLLNVGAARGVRRRRSVRKWRSFCRGRVPTCCTATS